MARFPGFDGLRGWLSWVVVACHVVYFTGLIERCPPLSLLQQMGDEAVAIFIVLSGFVITHLIVEKQEPYGRYLWRRFLRIYPTYALALALGIATTWLSFDTFLSLPPADVFPMPELARLARQRAAFAGQGFIDNLLLHVSLLHGAVPSNVRFESQYAFLRPAWSLSLEWQFYLVAPLVVWAARRRWPSIVLAVVSLLAYRAYLRGYFGAFALPSILPGAALLFGIGIVTCLLVHRSRSHGSWLALVLLVAGYIHWPPPTHWALAIWLLFFGASMWSASPGRAGTLVAAIYGTLFESRAARHFGLPSFSTYLLHLPILQAVQYLAVRQFELGAVAANAFAVVGTLALTYLASQAAYRWIERPFILAGRRSDRAPAAAATPGISRPGDA